MEPFYLFEEHRGTYIHKKKYFLDVCGKSSKISGIHPSDVSRIKKPRLLDSCCISGSLFLSRESMVEKMGEEEEVGEEEEEQQEEE